jgi:tryptophanyl-tRNA synthetase
MSKSIEGSYISLTDDLKQISGKIARMPTDGGGPGEVPKEGPVANIFKYMELFKPERLEYYAAAYRQGECRYGEMKQELAQAIFQELQPIQKRRSEIEARPGYVEKVITEGAEKARKKAAETLKEVKEKMGLMV